MRFLIGLIFCVALVPAVSAQQVRLKLHDGQLLLGELVAITDDTIEIKVGEGIVRVTVEEVAEFSEVVVDPAREKPVTETPSTDPPPTNPLPTVPPPTDPPAMGQDPPATPGGAAPKPKTPSAVSAASGLSRNMYAARLGWIPERYNWITPDDTTSLASMLVLLLFVLGGSIHFSTNVANIEYRSVGRSVMLAVVVMVAGGIQIGFVPISPVAVGSMVLGNMVVWIALTAGLFQAPRFAAITMVVVTVLCMLVSFVVLEVVDSIFGMVGDGIGREW